MRAFFSPQKRLNLDQIWAPDVKVISCTFLKKTILKFTLFLASWLSVFSSALAIVITPTPPPNPHALNMPQGVTPISHEIYDLHMTIFWICVVIGVIVFSVLIYSLIKYRHSKGAIPADFHEHTLVEITWAIIPFIILVAMAIPATLVLMKMDDTADSDVTIKITGYQWKWRYEYLDQGVSYFSNLSTPMDQISGKSPKNQWYLLEVDHPLVLPIHKKIRFLVTSNDVIHSWWVPSFGIKRDAIPGYIHEAWARIEKPGIYRGQCAELCGTNHGFMPIVVQAVDPQEFDRWVKAQTQGQVTSAAQNKIFTKAELMARGEKGYLTYCAVCHKPDGMGLPPAFPSIKDSKVATGPKTKHIDTVVKGVAGTAMQAFGEQLSDEDLAAIITYERNAFGNDKSPTQYAGGVVQPADIALARAR